MAKYAKLSDGQVLDFPDEMPDEEMHRSVKKHMGIPVPPTPEEAMRSEDVAATGERNQALMMLAQQMAQLNAGIARLCQDQYTTQALLKQVAQSVGQLDQTVAAAARVVFKGLTAPTRQVIKRDSKGKIEETTITKEVK